MKRVYKTWDSKILGREAQLIIYGSAGTPVILFPSAHGDVKEWDTPDRIGVLQDQIENEHNQFFLLDSFADHTFMNQDLTSLEKMKNLGKYQKFIIDEILQEIANINSNPFVIVSGVAIGAYLALLMALKHPQLFNKVISICGYFDIRVHLDDKPHVSIYFNNPIEFVPNINDNNLLQHISAVDIRLLNYINDPTKKDTRKMSDLLWLKFIEHEHYVWENETDDLWTLAPGMLKDNLF